MNKYMNLIGIKSRKASERKVDTNTKNKVLNLYARLLDKEKKSIIRENLNQHQILYPMDYLYKEMPVII